jgi:hypothetical protein
MTVHHSGSDYRPTVTPDYDATVTQPTRALYPRVASPRRIDWSDSLVTDWYTSAAFDEGM